MSELAEQSESQPTDAAQDTHREREHFFGAAKRVALLTMLSRILGLVRDMLMVPLGPRVLADQFWWAYSIPNLFRRLFGEGALSAAFVPVFSETAESEGWDRARVVLANVAGVLSVLLAGLVALVLLGLWIAWPWIGGSDRFLVQMTAIVMPFMITICMLALGSAALQCRGRFAYPAFAPIILNVGLIITAVWVAPRAATPEGQFYCLGGGLLIAGVIQVIGVVWLLRRAGLAAIPTIRPILPELKRVAKLMGPMMIPLGMLQFSAFLDKTLALLFSGDAAWQPLEVGAVRCLYASARLYMLPLGVLAIPIATVIFPLLSRYATRNDKRGLCETTNRALRLGLFFGIPSGLALMLLSREMMGLIYQRGTFTAADTERGALVLQMYCLGMWAYFCNQILLRAFFSIKHTREPLRIAMVLVVVNTILVVGGMFTPLKVSAVGLATAITAGANTLLLSWKLHGLFGELGVRRILASLLKILIASAAMGGAMWWVGSYTLFGTNTTGQILHLGLTCVTGVGVYFFATLLLGCVELGELRNRKAA